MYSEQMRVIQRKTDNCQKKPNSTGPESRKGIVAHGLRMNEFPENKLPGKWGWQSPVHKAHVLSPSLSLLSHSLLHTEELNS